MKKKRIKLYIYADELNNIIHYYSFWNLLIGMEIGIVLVGLLYILLSSLIQIL